MQVVAVGVALVRQGHSIADDLVAPSNELDFIFYGLMLLHLFL